jgi:hypothetical protein
MPPRVAGKLSAILRGIKPHQRRNGKMTLNTQIFSGRERQRKTVFGSHAQTAHVWAQQSEDTHYGRSSDGRMFFEGASIFSYRSSWTIARFVTNARGERAVLFNANNYSISTSKHTGHARHAVRGDVPIFHVDNPERDPDKVQTKERAATALEKAIRTVARSRTNTEWRMRDAEKIATEANALAQFYGWRWRLPMPQWSPEFLADAKDRAAKEQAKRAAETKHRNDALQAQIKDTITAWLAGEPVSFPSWQYQGPTLLRIKGEDIQTSKGASVPIEHAKRAWPIIKRCHDRATAWQSNGHTLPVGHFKIERIETDGTVIAGCHRIGFAELHRIAVELNVA